MNGKNIGCGLLFLLPHISMAYTACTSTVTRELEACAKSNFEESDSHLNSQYRIILAGLVGGDRDVLVKAQREWISYKEAVCQGAYESTYPGEEAGIDKLTCLDEVTRARRRELEHFNSGIGGDEFLHAINIVAKYYEHGNRDSFISRLVNEFSGDSDALWRTYVNDNCAFAASRIHEKKDECVARQEFYRYAE
ncbi:hypothetical protein LMG28614_03198 [Paraburkholderia ultramafica]|uniref:Lysozyme inhibitor LprI-like N-terminal domain-containing protein n=1 Tax=Paraburkholderia ultramafica TaxID=1544867 RepID=A0A6S7B7Z1_9BURK|nr:lysozyme inhibitor LprI family protein [Paraburkholderia ultramafica]CAB3790931.1 hypothetical protein LMG28614_03198 [Paraburkholderia ultramafica]